MRKQKSPYWIQQHAHASLMGGTHARNQHKHSRMHLYMLTHTHASAGCLRLHNPFPSSHARLQASPYMFQKAPACFSKTARITDTSATLRWLLVNQCKHSRVNMFTHMRTHASAGCLPVHDPFHTHTRVCRQVPTCSVNVAHNKHVRDQGKHSRMHMYTHMRTHASVHTCHLHSTHM